MGLRANGIIFYFVHDNYFDNVSHGLVGKGGFMSRGTEAMAEEIQTF